MYIKMEIDFKFLKNNCWSGGLYILDIIERNELQDELVQLLEEETFGDSIPTLTEINDLLWFDNEWIFEQLGLEVEE